MKEYQSQLKAFSFRDDGDKSEIYFEKYWLFQDEYLANWREVQLSIFNEINIELPCQVFRKGFTTLPMIGGVLFCEKDYKILQNCMKVVGDSHFVIIENYDMLSPPHKSGPPLQFKFPATVSWQELNSGGYISTELFGMPHKNYFVFGNTGYWGKYTASDNDMPLDIVGCMDRYLQIFKDAFLELKGDYQKLAKFLPAPYLDNGWIR